MRFSMIGGAVLLLLSFVSCASIDAETQARADDLWNRYETQAERVCVGERKLLFGYLPYDRSTFQPVHFSPTMEADLMKTIAEVEDRFNDPQITADLRGPLNDAVNARLEDLRSGRYNQIYVKLSPMLFLGVTPSEHEDSRVVTWTPRAVGSKVLTALVIGDTPNDLIHLVEPGGTTFKRIASQEEKPAWSRHYYGKYLEQVAIAPGARARAREATLEQCP